MAYVIAEPCIDVLDQSCVAVCPVDCIHFEEGSDRKLFIDPNECIDCGACEPECPVTAIFPEDPARLRHTVLLTTHYLEEAEALCGRIAMLKRGEIVASDTTQNLLNSFSGCQVKLKLAPPGLPAGLQPIRTQGDAEDCRLTLDGYDGVERVLASLRTAGVRVLGMEVAQPDLEEVFVKIMNH